MNFAHLADVFAPIACATLEIVAFAYLDSAGRVLGLRHIRMGDTLCVEVPIRAVVRDALAFDAQQVAMAHNHPSGNAEPSRNDLTVTRRIAMVFAALGIRLVDHLVFGGGNIVSLRARGLL